MARRFWIRIFDGVACVFWKVLRLICNNIFEFHFPKVSASDVAKWKRLYCVKQSVPWLEIFDFLIKKNRISAGAQKSKILVRHIISELLYIYPALPGALAARSCPFVVGKWLVEWLHRRVLASAGAFCRRKLLVHSMARRFWIRIFDGVACVFWKSFAINMLV